jgi:transposase, IS5 family
MGRGHLAVATPQFLAKQANMKAEHRMGRNYLWYRQGDAINAVLAAAGYNFSRVLWWLRLLLCRILLALFASHQSVPA